MATAVRVRFPPSAPARHQGLWQLAATLSFLVVSSSAASPARPLFFLPLRIWVKQVVQKVPQMPSAAASSAHPHGTCHSHPATRRSGQHLLCVGRIFYFRCALPAAAKKRLGNAEIRLSLGTCFRQEAKMLACQLFALLHASLPGVPDLPTLRDILVRHLSAIQGKDVSEYGKRGPRKTALPCSISQAPAMTVTNSMDAGDARGFTVSSFSCDRQPAYSATGFTSSARKAVCQDTCLHPLSQPVTAKISPLSTARFLGKHVAAISPDGALASPSVTSCSAENSIRTDHPHGMLCPDTLLLLREELLSRNDLNPNTIHEIFKRYLNNYAPVTVAAEPEASSVQVSRKKRGIRLSTFIRRYTESKLADKRWTADNLTTQQGRLETLIEILGDRDILQLQRDDLRYYRDTLRKLPPNRKKSPLYKGKSISQILAMSPATTLSIKTVNVTVEAVASMFEWGIREGLLTTNPAKALQIKDTRRDIELREAFTQEDITLLFSPKTFTESSVKHPSFYWAPLIGLYTGMRLEEICQLHCSDIRQEQNIWYIDINTDHHDKRLKNRNAFRKIPVHNDLLAYGFIKYVDRMKLNGQERLFPELRKTEKCPKYGHMVSNFFSRYIERCGITGKKSFHSLRHTFSDFFKRLNLHTDVFRQIFGHEIPHLATRQYGSEFPVSQCYQEIISHLDVHKK